MILEFRNIEKSFGDKKVLKGINFTAKSGVAKGVMVVVKPQVLGFCWIFLNQIKEKYYLMGDHLTTAK